MKEWSYCSKDQQIERWEQCLRVLQNLTPHQRRKHWDMRNWGVKTECGTVACAAGHCGLDLWFRRRGLVLVPDNFISGWNGDGGFKNDVRVEDFFGYDGTRRIFWRHTPRPVSAVIREVRAYIKELKA